MEELCRGVQVPIVEVSDGALREIPVVISGSLCELEPEWEEAILQSKNGKTVPKK